MISESEIYKLTVFQAFDVPLDVFAVGEPGWTMNGHYETNTDLNGTSIFSIEGTLNSITNLQKYRSHSSSVVIGSQEE